MARFTCARCKQFFPNASCSAESGIYQSRHVLCEPCFFDEDAEIEERGTNNLLDTLEKYEPENADV